MTGYEQCTTVNGRWHIVTQLHENADGTWKEDVEFSFYFDSSGQPRIDVLNFGVFTRSTPRGTWRLQGTRRRRVTKAEKLKLLDHAKWLVGRYAIVELVQTAPKEPLPTIKPGAERLSEALSIGDGFSTIKVFTCPLDERYGNLFTVPRFWKALLVIQMWAGDRLVEMKVLGIGANWFRTLEKQGVPNGVPDERQRAILNLYFVQRADALARLFHSHSGEHGRSLGDAQDPGIVEPTNRVQ